MNRFKRPLSRVWRSLWVGSSCVVFILAGILILKFYEDEMRSQERGQLVSSIVDQQFHDLKAPANVGGVLLVGESWADNSVELKRWMVRQSLGTMSGPIGVLRRFEEVRHSHRHSRSMEVSLDRWQDSLRRWSNETRSRNLTSDELLREGRAHYFEAAGYNKIGRRYDGAVLQLWTISLLTRFIAKKPFDPQVPEALFMLGVEYLSLGPALPSIMRGDRILNLCSELYPNSFWANRSNGVWREAVSNEI